MFGSKYTFIFWASTPHPFRWFAASLVFEPGSSLDKHDIPLLMIRVVWNTWCMILSGPAWLFCHTLCWILWVNTRTRSWVPGPVPIAAVASFGAENRWGAGGWETAMEGRKFPPAPYEREGQRILLINWKWPLILVCGLMESRLSKLYDPRAALRHRNHWVRWGGTRGGNLLHFTRNSDIVLMEIKYDVFNKTWKKVYNCISYINNMKNTKPKPNKHCAVLRSAVNAIMFSCSPFYSGIWGLLKSQTGQTKGLPPGLSGKNNIHLWVGSSCMPELEAMTSSPGLGWSLNLASGSLSSFSLVFCLSSHFSLSECIILPFQSPLSFCTEPFLHPSVSIPGHLLLLLHFPISIPFVGSRVGRTYNLPHWSHFLLYSWLALGKGPGPTFGFYTPNTETWELAEEDFRQFMLFWSPSCPKT